MTPDLSEGKEEDMASGGRLPAHASDEAATPAQHSAGKNGHATRASIAAVFAFHVSQGTATPDQERQLIEYLTEKTRPSLADREAPILRDWQLGNLTPLGVANALMRAGFNSRYATDRANALARDGARSASPPLPEPAHGSSEPVTDGLGVAGWEQPMRDAVYAWVREDLDVGAKMLVGFHIRKLMDRLSALPDQAPSLDLSAVREAAYEQGWNDRGEDLIADAQCAAPSLEGSRGEVGGELKRLRDALEKIANAAISTHAANIAREALSIEGPVGREGSSVAESTDAPAFGAATDGLRKSERGAS